MQQVIIGLDAMEMINEMELPGIDFERDGIEDEDSDVEDDDDDEEDDDEEDVDYDSVCLCFHFIRRGMHGCCKTFLII